MHEFLEDDAHCFVGEQKQQIKVDILILNGIRINRHHCSIYYCYPVVLQDHNGVLKIMGWF